MNKPNKNSTIYNFIRMQIPVLLLAICLTLMLPVQTYAASVPDAVKRGKSSVMQLVVYYQDEDGTRYTLQTGSCFMINKSTVATCSHVTQLTQDELSQIAEHRQISESEVLEHVGMSVVTGNTWIGAQISCANEKLDLALLRLTGSLPSSKTALKLRASSELRQKEKCYAIGYPGTMADADTGIVEKAMTTTGKVTRLVSFKDNPAYYYLENTASIVSGDSGGALLDQYGFAIGVVKAVGMDDNGNVRYYAVTTNEMMSLLDRNDISYTRDSREEAVYGNLLYQVTDYNKKTAWVEDSSKNIRTASIKSKVTIGGRSYKVTAIRKNAFKNHKYLKSVTIGSNVREIGSQAFYGCKKLNRVTIKSENLKRVGSKAVKGIQKKAKFKVPAGKAGAYRRLFSQAGGVKSGMKFSAK